MKQIGLSLVSVMLSFSAGPAVSQGTSSPSAIGDAILSAYREIDGTEIDFSGAIGSLFGDDLYLITDNGRYQVMLDAGREVRRQIEGCELKLFDADDSECQISGSAEVSVDFEDENLADGYEIRLVLYQVSSFERTVQ